MEPDRLIECLPNSLRPTAEGDSSKNAASANQSDHHSKSIENAIYKPPTLIPPRILPLLHDLAEQVVKAGNQQQCLKIYRYNAIICFFLIVLHPSVVLISTSVFISVHRES